MNTDAESEITHQNPGQFKEAAVAFYTEFHALNKKIRTLELGDFGYRYTARHMAVTPALKLYELLPIDSSRQADACFLSADAKLGGVIVPYSFHEHRARAKTRLSWRLV